MKIYNKLKLNIDNNNNIQNDNLQNDNLQNNDINFQKLNLNDNIFNNFSNPIVPGSINSIKRITKYVNLHINSAFRNNYYKSQSTNFSYNLPNIYHNVVSLKLNSIELKHTWMFINERNNFFYIETPNDKHKIILNIQDANINLNAEIINQLQIFKNNTNINIFSEFDIEKDILILVLFMKICN